MEAGRLSALEGVRGLAALVVVLDHTAINTSFARNGFGFWVSTFFGSAAVGTFFLLSGYVILLNLQKLKAGQFLFLRAFRLYPTIIASTVIMLIVQLAVGTIQMSPTTLIIFFLNISLFGDILFPIEANILPIIWTLTIEVMFYLIAALILKLSGSNYSNRVQLLMCALPLFLISVSLLVSWMPFSNFKTWLSFGFSMLPLMFLGSIAALRQNKLMSKVHVFLVALMLILAIYLAPIPELYSLDKGLPSFAVSIIIFCCALFVTSAKKVLSFPSLTWLGDISYPLYAVHTAMIPLVIFLAEPRNPKNELLSSLVITVASLVVATIIHRLIECPLVVWSKGFSKRNWGNRQALPADVSVVWKG